MLAALRPARRNTKINLTTGAVSGFGASCCNSTPRRANARFGCTPTSTSM
ncbi:hypothetical protein APASM_4581 [Actinosynnema pretiosum subsp. pretiosum]|nr:hypothetical protein APASM_4581 [Actinosynnema pretiosum subsp. pretiosum]